MRLPNEDVYGEIMQQADVSALRLLEALVVTLPETLLHTYVLICTDIGIKSPGTERGGDCAYVQSMTNNIIQQGSLNIYTSWISKCIDLD